MAKSTDDGYFSSAELVERERQRSIEGEAVPPDDEDDGQDPKDGRYTTVPQVEDTENQPTPTQETKHVHWIERKLKTPPSIAWLILNSLVSLFWGIALGIFSTGLVKMPWTLSELLKKVDQDFRNEGIGIIGSLTTLHATYILQLVLEQYEERVVLAREFTLGELRWIQDVKDMTIFARFPDGTHGVDRRGPGWVGAVVRFCSGKRVVFYVVYVALALHTMSIVAIMQPDIKIQHVMFNDPVPCAVDSGELQSFAINDALDAEQQELLDKASFDIGLQMGRYADQVSANTTTTVWERNYAKDGYAYGALGGLVEGLQEIPGVEFAATCDEEDEIGTDIWKLTFPDLVPPAFTPTNITEGSPVPPTLGRVMSHPTISFNLSTTEGFFYALVDPLGNGAFLALNYIGPGLEVPASLHCSWKTHPKLLHVQMVNFTARVIGADETPNAYPYPIGRAVRSTLQGMATAARLGGTLHPWPLLFQYRLVLPGAGPSYHIDGVRTGRVVEVLLADGGKAALTAFNTRVNWREQEQQRRGVVCDSHNRTVSEHWKFGNRYHLGWIAIVVTTATGALGVGVGLWVRARRRGGEVGGGVLPLGGSGYVVCVGGDVGGERDGRRFVIVEGRVEEVGGDQRGEKVGEGAATP